MSVLASVMPAAAEDLASQLVGVWKFTSQSQKDVASGKVEAPFGEKVNGYIIYSRGGHLAFVLVGDKRKPTASANFTDAERVDLYNTMAAASGTYKVEGNIIIVTYDTAWNPNWNGLTQKRQAEIQGNKLTLTSSPAKNPSGQDIVFTVTLERVE